MLTFKKIVYKNILSVGNNPIEINFDTHKKTLITGGNGGGKSTLIEALALVLYGKPFRNINKGALVNSINKKALTVELDLTIQKDEYKIIRGIKPNVFTVSKNGKELEQLGAVADFQEWLEETILKMSFITFKQIIVLGTAGFEPFMDLPPVKRRAIVEDLVDVGIFTKMSDINKGVIRDLKTNLTIENNSLESLTRILEVQEKNSTSMIESIQEQLDTLAERYETYIAEAKATNVILKEKSSGLESIDKENSEVIAIMQKCMADELALLDPSKKITALKDQHDQDIEDLEHEMGASYNSFKEGVDADIEALKATHQEEVNLIVGSIYVKPDFTDKQSIISKSKSDISGMKSVIKTNEDRTKFFDHTVTCPTCESSLDDEYREKMTTVLDAETKACTIRIQKQTIIIGKCNDYITRETDKAAASDLDGQAKLKAAGIDFEAKEKELTEVISVRVSTDQRAIAVFCRKLTAELADFKVDANAKVFEHKQKCMGEVSDLQLKNSTDTQVLRDECGQLRSDATNSLKTAKTIATDISGLNTKLELLKSNTGDVEKAKSDIKSCNDSVKKYTLEIKNLAILQTLLKDDGIKAKVIKQYIPFINTSINGYLQTMGSKINFTLDEGFNEKIKSRGREEFTYNSFSQGEKMRIDVAIMFTWRDVIRKRTNFISNLLIMDEVMDGASDDAGIKSLHKLIDSLNDNVIIISHNETHDLDKFNNHLTMHKKGNFTYKMEN
ncbi:nuclease [Paraglaciecola Antarctic GD virus 1]|nr:nuclease [Paraglaciecola Antarctic GD virus 1]